MISIIQELVLVKKKWYRPLTKGRCQLTQSNSKVCGSTKILHPDKNIEENIHTPKGAQSWLSLSSGHEMLIDHWGEMKPSRWRNRMECAECCRVALHILQHFAAFSTCN